MTNNVFIDLSEELYNKGWTVHWEFNSGALKYNDCTTYTECRAINADVANDVDENGAWNYRLDNLETGGGANYEGLFRESEKLKSFNVDLPKLTKGYYMFRDCENLTSFSSDLSSMTGGSDMFYQCINLTEWNVPLPNLTDGYFMFSGCSGLTSWNIDLPKLTGGSYMFYACVNLTSFSGDLSAMTSGENMFQHCWNLTSFSSDLSSLVNGRWLFGSDTYNCTKLDLASLQHIANTIKDNVATGQGFGLITIGISSSIQGTPELETALKTFIDKGWFVEEIYRS